MGPLKPRRPVSQAFAIEISQADLEPQNNGAHCSGVCLVHASSNATHTEIVIAYTARHETANGSTVRHGAGVGYLVLDQPYPAQVLAEAAGSATNGTLTTREEADGSASAELALDQLRVRGPVRAELT